MNSIATMNASCERAPTTRDTAPMPAAPPVSCLIYTLNEEVNLPHCLASLRWCDDVVVVDSFSTDDTTVLARASVFAARFPARDARTKLERSSFCIHRGIVRDLGI